MSGGQGPVSGVMPPPGGNPPRHCGVMAVAEERAVGDIALGARNLLLECGRFESGDDLLIVHEDPSLGWYDEAAPLAVADEARRLGMTVSLLRVGAPTNRRDGATADIIAAHRNVIFFARIGDQHRFESVGGRKSVRIMSYVRSGEMLASDYGCLSHTAMKTLKDAVDAALLDAGRIEITCPLGTHISGTVSPRQWRDGDVSVRRFPLGVPIPVLADDFAGEVVLAGYLTPTGSKVYEPDCLILQEPVVAEIGGGRIQDIRGRADVVDKVQAHYAQVADQFGLEGDIVHSWHAGIHPGFRHVGSIDTNPALWCNTVFVSPRYLHFHTCGAYPPGEICWMITDHSVGVDGVWLWENGRFHPDRHPKTAGVVDASPDLAGRFPA